MTIRHWMAFVTLGAVAAGAWWLWAYHRAPAPVALPAWYINDPEDTRAHVSILAVRPTTREAGVLILGTSTGRHSLWTDSALMSAAPPPARGVRFVNLSADRLGVLEMLFLLWLAEPGPGQVVAITTHPDLFALDPEQDPFRKGEMLRPLAPFAEAFQDSIPLLRDWLRPVPRHRIAFDLTRQLADRAIRDGIREWSSTYLFHDRHDRVAEAQPLFMVPGDSREIEASGERGRRMLARGFNAFHRVNARTLTVMLRFIRAKGGKAVLIEAPRIAANDSVTYGPHWARYQSMIVALTDSLAVPYLDPNQTLQLPAGLFRDTRHLAREGRARWSKAFLAEVASWCSGQRVGPMRGCQ